MRSASLDATHGEFIRSMRGGALVLDRSTVTTSRSASPRLRLGVASRVRGLPVHHAPERSSYSALRLQIAVARPLSRHAAHPPSVAAIRYILPAPRTRSVVATFRGCRLAAKSAFLCGSHAGALTVQIARCCVLRAISVMQPMRCAQCPTGTSRRHRPPACIARSHRPWPWLALAVCARRAA